MLRTVLFTLFGLCVGLCYASAVWWSGGRTEPIAAGFWCVALVTFFSFCGWGASNSSEMRTRTSLCYLAFLPFVLLYSTVMMAIFVAAIPYYWIRAGRDRRRRERYFLSELNRQGRLCELSRLREKLAEGIGTLIEEVGFRGTCHIWWTEEDLLALGTPPTEEEELEILYRAIPHSFNYECIRKYLASDGGIGVILDVKANRNSIRALQRDYPKMKWVRLCNVWTHP